MCQHKGNIKAMKSCINYDLIPQSPYMYTKPTLRKEDHIG